MRKIKYWIKNKLFPDWCYSSHRMMVKEASTCLSIPDSKAIAVEGTKECSDVPTSSRRRFFNFDQFIEKTLDDYPVACGNPPSVVYYNVVYIPEFRSLYRTDGSKIKDSVLCRGQNQRDVSGSPDNIQVPVGLREYADRMIYVGQAHVPHYGHLLTEGIARLWITASNSHERLLCHDTFIRHPLRSYAFDAMYQTLALKSRLISFSRPTLLREVVIPLPAFINLNRAYTAHRLVPETLASIMLGDGHIIKTDQPAYLSRTKLPKTVRQINGEMELETQLRAKNWAVYYPEQLTLDQQVNLFNRHNVIVGCSGSSLHNMVYRITGPVQQVCIESRSGINPNNLMFDAIKNLDSIYIGTLNRLSKSPINKQDVSKLPMTMDVTSTVAALSELGLI